MADADLPIVKVYMLDNSSKQFTVEPTVTAGELRQLMAGKMNFQDESSASNFALFQSVDGVVARRPLDDAESVFAVQNESAKLLYMLKLFVPSVLKRLDDPVLLHLLYVQSMHAVITGTNFHTEEAKCVELAAVDFYVKYGAADPDKHKVGFVTARLQEFIPAHMFPSKTADEWEEQLYAAHAALGSEASGADMKKRYVNTCEEWAGNGCLFVEVGQTHLSEAPEAVLLGINFKGIHVLHPTSRESLELIEWTQINSWNATPKVDFYIRVQGATPDKRSFTTLFGPLLVEYAKSYTAALAEEMMAATSLEEDGGTDEGKK